MSRPHPMPRRDEWLEFWEQREVVFFTTLPYPLLALCVVFDLVTRHGLDEQTGVDLGLAAVAAVLMATVDRLDRRSSWTEPSTLGAGIAAAVFAALAAISVVLVIRGPLYGFYAWTGYLWAWRLLTDHWRLVGIALVAAALAISQTGSGPYRTVDQVGGLLAVYLIDLCVAGGLSWFGWIGSEQQRRRAQEVSALTAANAKLEQSLRHNADLHEQLLTHAREAGISEERRRMAREIHDTLAQGLTGIITQLQAAQRAGTGRPAGAQHLESAIALARDSLTEARRSVQALSPEPLADARLPDAIQDVAQRWSDLHEIPVALTITGSSRAIRPEIEVALLRTTQEALSNIAKHARASRAGLTLSYMQDLVTLDVRDDGVGFEHSRRGRPRHPRDAQGGFGLSSMRQRIEGIGGTLEIEADSMSGPRSAPPCPSSRMDANGERADPAADRRRPPGRPQRAERHVRGEPAFEVVGEAADGSEAVRRARALSPDVILMDLRMPNMDGVSAIAALASTGVPARVLVLTTYDADSDVLAAIEAGATGYLLKDAPPAELFRAVRAAANGEAVLSPAVAARIMGQYARLPGSRSANASSRCSS